MLAKLQNSSTWCRPAADRWVSNVISQRVVNSMMIVWTHYLGVSGTTSIHLYVSQKNLPPCIMVTLKFCSSGTEPEVKANGSCCQFALKQKLLPKTVLLTVDPIFVCKCWIVCWSTGLLFCVKLWELKITQIDFQWLWFYNNIFLWKGGGGCCWFFPHKNPLCLNRNLQYSNLIMLWYCSFD